MRSSVIVFCLLLICFSVTWAENNTDLCRVEKKITSEPIQVVTPQNTTFGEKSGNYNGHLRVYIVEPTSRWLDYNYYNYGNGFLDWVFNDDISIPYEGTYEETRIWKGTAAGYPDVTEGNLMAIAVVTNDEPHAANSQTEPGYPSAPFTAYYVDACAGAEPGETVSDTAYDAWTHTVFVEEGTATWCPSCPAARQSLYNLFHSGNYNFYYAAMIIDVNTLADNRMQNDFNLYWVPTCYSDGGYGVYAGGSQTAIAGIINSAGAHSVYDIDLTVSATWLGGAQLEVTVSITNNQFFNSPPLLPPAPDGPDTCVTSGPIEFSTSTTDPDDQNLWYQLSWGDGQTSEWHGPHASGEMCYITHPYAQVGTFPVKVKAKDEMDSETNWSDLKVIRVEKRGDANHDGGVNIGDGVYLINFVFKGGSSPEPIMECGDANCDGGANVGDAVFIINFVFKGGPPPGCY